MIPVWKTISSHSTNLVCDVIQSTNKAINQSIKRSISNGAVACESYIDWRWSNVIVYASLRSGTKIKQSPGECINDTFSFHQRTPNMETTRREWKTGRISLCRTDDQMTGKKFRHTKIPSDAMSTVTMTRAEITSIWPFSMTYPKPDQCLAQSSTILSHQSLIIVINDDHCIVDVLPLCDDKNDAARQGWVPFSVVSSCPPLARPHWAASASAHPRLQRRAAAEDGIWLIRRPR